MLVDDQQSWNLGTVRLRGLLEDLHSDNREMVMLLLATYRQTKESLVSLVAGIGSATVCQECGGQCCQNGKYRITVLDYLACLADEINFAADFTQKPLCPYGTNTGCTLEPGFRPADCVLFICDTLEKKLSAQARLLFAVQEKLLRECIRDASRVVGLNAGTPLLIWADNHVKNKI
jgi:hypothetical protein